jgi:transposase InsO family protein
MRLSNSEFEELALGLAWSQETTDYVNRLRHSDPVRLVRGQVGNVRGRYPSKKNGCVCQFESHTCELAFILDAEYHQEDIYEYYDQPATFPIEYKNAKGRRITRNHTPDFLVIAKLRAYFVECKSEEQLIKLSKKFPGLFRLGNDGKWRCPAAEAYTKPLGLEYLVISTAEFDRTQIRNTVFLEDYLDKDLPPIADETRDKLVSIVASNNGISLTVLISDALEFGATADDVYSLIAKSEIYVDLSREPLVERDHVLVFRSKEAAQAFTPINSATVFAKGRYVNLKEGTRVCFGQSVLRIVLLSSDKIFLEGENGSAPCMSLAQFEKLVLDGEITSLDNDPESDPDLRWKRILNEATEKERAKANWIEKMVTAHLRGEPLPIHVPARTLARYKSKYFTGQRMYGNGLVGVLPNYHLRGDTTTDRIHPEVRSIMTDLIENDYETVVQKGMFVVWGKLVNKCKALKIKVRNGKKKWPSYVTFTKYVRSRPQHLQALKRRGHRAAYFKERFYHWLEKDTPRHGDRPMEICHIDHTELNIELVDLETGEIYHKCWATFMVDAYSRRIVAVFLSFDPPSYRSSMMVLRECVRRTGRLPQILVVDGGFHSIYFETFAAAFEITIKVRPRDKPRFGSPCERLFDTTTEQFVYTKLGNTRITRTNVRHVTRENDPRKLAVWNFGDLWDTLRDWCYEDYDTDVHSTLKRTPRDVYKTGLQLTGERRHRLIAYDEEFQLLSLPSTAKGTAKNIVGCGVKINGRYYWCDELGEAEFEGKQIEIRYDPFNIAIAYCYLHGRWIQCISDRHLELLGRTEREQQVMSALERMRERAFSGELSERAEKRALRLLADEAKEDQLSDALRLVRAKQRQNEIALKAINGTTTALLEATGPLTHDLVDSSTLLRPKVASLFSHIDRKSLVQVEEYE